MFLVLIVFDHLHILGNNNNSLYLPLAVFTAQRLVGPSKQKKQIIQIEHDIVKNLNWPNANQLP